MIEAAGLDRRELIIRLGLLLGTTAGTTISLPALAASSKRGKKQQPFLAADVSAVLTAFCDTLLPRTETPGALDSHTPERFDDLLRNWASASRASELVFALKQIDAAAAATGAKGFAALPVAERKALLTSHDKAALKTAPRKQVLTGIAALRAGPSVIDPSYAKLKELVVILHYISEQALTSDLAYEHAPGEWRPSVPVTPQTRPSVGGVI